MKPRPLGSRFPAFDQIPAGTFSVILEAGGGKQRHYRFSPLGEGEYRLTVIAGETPSFTKCRIRRLAKGRLMFVDINTPMGDYASFGRVAHISPGML
jgi:hypothetical protein